MRLGGVVRSGGERRLPRRPFFPKTGNKVPKEQGNKETGNRPPPPHPATPGTSQKLDAGEAPPPVREVNQEPEAGSLRPEAVEPEKNGL